VVRDRTGEVLDPDPDDDWTPHEDRCRDGWLREDADGRPSPCLLCRPHLARRRKASR